jgi:hypothetical protein
VPIPQKVIVEEELIYSPYPRDNGVIPPEHDHDCDYIHFLRYRPETPDGSIKEVNGILLLISGGFSGNTSFDYLGRQLVSMAEQDGSGSVEVWAIDRRYNCLEDLTGMNEAEQAGDPQIAVEYYYDLQGNGTDFQGFLTSNDVPFLYEFGVGMFMNDIYTIITTKIPDLEARKKTLFIGGMSLGVMFTTAFAGWDFDGDPNTVADAGFNNCAGLIGLDMPLEIPPSPDNPFLPPSVINMISDGTQYEDELEAIRIGASSRLAYDDSVLVAYPEHHVFHEIVALYASFFPDQEATWLKDVPWSDRVRDDSHFLNSRDLTHYLMGEPLDKPYLIGELNRTHFRFTNEALLGTANSVADDNSAILRMSQVSFGFLCGGAVVKKTFVKEAAPLAGLFGLDPVVFEDEEVLWIPWDAGVPGNLGSGPLYSWANFDEFGNDYKDTTGQVTFTTSEEEVTDIQDYARIVYAGNSNRLEWYVPSRFVLDMRAAVATNFNAADPCSSYGLCFLHPDAPEELRAQYKIKEFLTDNFPEPDPNDPRVNPPTPDPNLAGYDHADVIFAAVDRPTRRPNEVFAPLMQWVFDHSGGTVVPLD